MLYLTFSFVLVLGIAVALFIRFLGLKLWQAVVCIAFGFLLAETSAAPIIRRILAAIAGFITGH